VGKQCHKAASKGNQILGIIKRSFTRRSKDIIIPLYKSLVRPHLDYCVQAWRRHLTNIGFKNREKDYALNGLPLGIIKEEIYYNN